MALHVHVHRHIYVNDFGPRQGHAPHAGLNATSLASPMNRLQNFLAALFLIATLIAAGISSPGFIYAQTNFPSGGANLFPGTLFGNQPSLFPEDGRIKVLVLGLNPFGMTESTAEQIALIIQKNLNNTGHFAVVGPREMSAAFEREQPDLIDCREIACGVESGKRLNADKVLVGTISLDKQIFALSVRLINTFNNIIDYKEKITFTDESMDENLFRLVNNISRSSIRIGKIVSTSPRGVFISLGARHGLRLGDQLVIYKQDAATNPLQADSALEQKKNIAIARTININENSSEAILVYKLEEPVPGQFVKTYLEPARQIKMVEDTRREIDTNIRLANKVLPLQLAPVLLADSERRKWENRLADAESEKGTWWIGAVAGGLATIFFLNQFDDTTIAQAELYGSIAVTGFSIWKIIKLNGEINDIRVEGRSKGYVTYELNFGVSPDGLSMAVAFRF